MRVMTMTMAVLVLAGCAPDTPEQAREKLSQQSVPQTEKSLLAKTKDAKSEDIAERLVRAGVNPNARQPNGMTALMSAVFNGQEDVAKALVEKGADVQASAKGFNALSLAVERGDKGMVKWLLSVGADANVRPSGGLSALEKAQQQQKMELVEVLQNAKR